MPPPFSPAHMETSPKQVRVLFSGRYIVDTKTAKLVWEKPFYPTYFFDVKDLPKDYLDAPKDVNGKTRVYDLVVGDRRVIEAVTEYTNGELSGLLRLLFSAADAWFEEDEQIYVHPKDPYKRVDVLHSSRNVRVEVNGVEVANTTQPRLLFETNLPTRTYIPKTDCRLDLLQPSELTTQCPYKGVANYYNVHLPDGKAVKDIVWWYRTPQLECAEIKGCVAFYNEKVDVWVDGEKQERPKTHFG